MEESMTTPTCSGYSRNPGFGNCPSSRTTCYMNYARDGYECKCTRVLMFTGENCENTPLLTCLVFFLGALLEIYLVVVVSRLMVNSLKLYRAATHDSYLASMQRNSRKRAQVFRIMACLTGGASCCCSAMFHLHIFVWLVGLTPPGLDRFSRKTPLTLYLNLVNITLSSVCLSIVYGYVMNLAEALGALSKRFARSLFLLLFLVSSTLTWIGMIVKDHMPSMVAVTLVVALGEVGARKVDRHAALQIMMSEGAGSFQNVSDRAMRVAVLTTSLKSFTEFMKRRVFLNNMLVLLMAATDFLDYLFPAIIVLLLYFAVICNTFMMQRKMVNFLRPHSSRYLHQQASACYQQASVRESAVPGHNTLAILWAYCRRRMHAGQSVALRVFPGFVSICADDVARNREVEKKDMEQIDNIKAQAN